MKLNNVEFINCEFDGVAITDHRELIKRLTTAKDLIADVYINQHLAFSNKLVISQDNSWLLGYVDGRFALTESVGIHSVIIKVHQRNSDVVIMSSNTNMNDIAPLTDIDADLNFCITSTVPNCDMKCNVPESRFKPMRQSNFTKIDLDTQPSVNPDVEPDIEFRVTLVDHRNFSDAVKDELKDYYTYYPEQAVGDGEEWPPYDSSHFPWIVVNYNFDGNTKIHIESELMAEAFEWQPSAFIGDDEDKPRTFGIIGLPEDLGLTAYADTDAGRDDLPTIEDFTVTLIKVD